MDRPVTDEEIRAYIQRAVAYCRNLDRNSHDLIKGRRVNWSDPDYMHQEQIADAAMEVANRLQADNV